MRILIIREKDLEFHSPQQVDSGLGSAALEKECFVAYQHELEGHFNARGKYKTVRCMGLCKSKSVVDLGWC